MHLKSAMEYKASFALTALGQFMTSFSAFGYAVGAVLPRGIRPFRTPAAGGRYIRLCAARKRYRLDGGRELGRYPLDIYGQSVLRFYTYVIPLACVQYYPLSYITARSGRFWYALLPLAGFVFLAPCCALWRTGVCHYKSTGS